MVGRLVCLLLLLIGALGCRQPVVAPSPSSSPAAELTRSPTSLPLGDVTVFAAASLTDAFKEIGREFEAKHPGSHVTLSFGASSQLRAQLEQGAKADVFASADAAQMDRARQSGVIAGDPVVFATNRLTIIVPKSNPKEVTSLKDLAKPGVKLVAEQPDVPIGQYANQILTKASQDPAYGADFKAKVEANVASREADVRQIVAKIALGEGDAGIVYTSDVTPEVAPKVTTVAIPDALNVVATYPIAAVSNGANPTAAARFIAYVRGPEGQAILTKWGFGRAPQ